MNKKIKITHHYEFSELIRIQFITIKHEHSLYIGTEMKEHDNPGPMKIENEDTLNYRFPVHCVFFSSKINDRHSKYPKNVLIMDDNTYFGYLISHNYR